MQVNVSIFKRQHSRVYHMQYRNAAGRKTRRSTTKTARRDAERIAAKWEAELREGRYQKASRTTWEDFRERYETEVLTGMKDTTHAKAASVFNGIERLLKPSLVADVTTERLSTYCAKMRAAGRAENTIKGHLAHLRAALQWAANIGIIVAVPKIPKLARAKQQKKMKGRPITTEEFERMLDKAAAVMGNAAAPSWRYLLKGLWRSGLRLSEALALTWDGDGGMRVDVNGRYPMFHIRAESEKGNQDRTLPMAPEFVEMLALTPDDRRTGRVFAPKPQRNHGRPMRLDTVSTKIVAIGRAANVKVDTRKAKKAKCDDDQPATVPVYASAHDLRRSFGERWASRVMPQTLKELMRHENVETTLRFYVGRNAETTAAVLQEAHRAASVAKLGAKVGAS